MVPPRVPQFNWVNLGLPSGTLWLDRLVGAPSPYVAGLYYQWGSVVGHTNTDGFLFDEASYKALGLNTINGNLTEVQDAARAYYGPEAKMPSKQQLIELAQNCSIEAISPYVHKFTSLLNGDSILVYYGGAMESSSHIDVGQLRVWTTEYIDTNTASQWHGDTAILRGRRIIGMNIMAVHS